METIKTGVSQPQIKQTIQLNLLHSSGQYFENMEISGLFVDEMEPNK